MRLVRDGALLAALLSFPFITWAQSTMGSISGTITDPNNASVPGARVVAKHLATNRDYSTQSTSAGIYVFPELPSGLFTLTVTVDGFKKSVQTDIEVRTGLRSTVDAELQVGSLQQSVEVKAQASLVETATPERGQNLSPQMVASLPIYNGGLRSAEAFVQFMPGVNTTGAIAEASINGSISRAKEVEIDGASLVNPESGGIINVFPGIEAFSEMKFLTANYNAEYGRVGGGIEQFTTKSGTNQIHGASFLNMRRDIWEAAGWASNSNVHNAPGYRPKDRDNEAGGAIGGPVYIPKIYDGRNKTFFYFTLAKDLRPATNAVNGGETVPTDLMKQGNFSQTATIYDPASTTNASGVSVRTPFAGNQIPTQQMSKLSQAMLSAIPQPTGAGTVGNYQFIQTGTHDDTLWTLKLDHSITDRHRLAFFVSKENVADNSASNFPGPLSNGFLQNYRADNTRVNYDFVVTPSLLLHSTFGMSRTAQTWNTPLQNGFASKIGLPLTGRSDVTPVINFLTDNLTSWGITQGKVDNGGQWNSTFHFSQLLSYVHGTHEFKAGLDIRRLHTDGNDWAGTNGTYDFSRAQTALPTALTSTGNAFASFLLGAANDASATATPVVGNHPRYAYQSVFLQDTWRLTHKLTLNLGVRYEVPMGWHDDLGNYNSVDLSRPNPGAGNLPGALIFAGYGAGRENKKMLYPTDYSNFGPRAGFAYQITSKTVARGGFGIYYETLGNGGCGCSDGFNGSYSQTSDGLNQAFNWDQGGVKPPAGWKAPPSLSPSYDNFNSGIYYMGPNYGNAPRIYNWSFTLEREIKNWLFEVAYVGNRGRGLNSTVYLNQLPTTDLSLGSLLSKSITDPAVVAAGYTQPFAGFAAGWRSGATLAQALRPYPQWGTVVDVNAGIGRTWYDALQTKVEHRFGNYQLMASFVWSKTLSLLTYRQIFSQGANIQTQDSYNLDDAKTLNPLSFPRVLNIVQTYSLPFGKGQRFLNQSGRALNLLVGGWQIAGAQQYRSGTLIQVVTPGNPDGTGVLFTPLTKAVLTGNPFRTNASATDLDPNNPGVRWFNSGANAPFASAAAYTLGNAAIYYDNFRNPWYRNENVSLIKSFAIWESVRLQHRADAINIFNRTDFGAVNGTVGSANFGLPTATQDAPRVITMGLRLEF